MKRKLSELQTERTEKLKKLSELVKAGETREFTDDEKSQFDTLESEVKTLNDDIVREEKRIAQESQLAKDKAGKPSPETQAARSFSIYRALNLILGNKPLDGVEAEMKQETEREMRGFGHSMSGNVGLPSFMLKIKGTNIGSVENGNIIGQARDLTAAGAATGDELVEDLPVGHVYALNIAPKVISVLGATVLPGLSSDIHLTKTGKATSVWATENATSTETTPSTARITMTPKRLTGYTEISKTLITQVPGFVEAWIRRELETSTNVALDAAAINGSGSSGQPTGILNFGAGVNTVAMGTPDGGAPTRAKFLEMWKLIAEDNADLDALAMLTTPGVKYKSMTTLLDAGSGRYIWENDMIVGLGAPCYTSNNVPSNLTKGAGTNLHAAILGVWNQLLIAQFGGLDLLIDPFSLSLTNMIRMVINTNWDINTRHLEAFCHSKDINVS